MVQTSLKKLKLHLANFDGVVKGKNHAHSITLRAVGFQTLQSLFFREEIIPICKALKDLFSTFNQQLVDELAEVQNVFYQMEQAMEQHQLDKLIGSQISDNNRKGVGYNAVTPPPTGLFAPPTIDSSSSGLEEFQPPKFDGYGLRANKSVSDNEDEVESPIVVEKKTVVPTIPKIDVVRPKQQEKSVRKTVRQVNTARPKAVVNAVRTNQMDAQAQGRQECSKEKEESREEYIKSRKIKKMKCL
ncbi:hypothetical protein Tco_0833871 [Tanacetum coccineum]